MFVILVVGNMVWVYIRFVYCNRDMFVCLNCFVNLKVCWIVLSGELNLGWGRFVIKIGYFFLVIWIEKGLVLGIINNGVNFVCLVSLFISVFDIFFVLFILVMLCIKVIVFFIMELVYCEYNI